MGFKKWLGPILLILGLLHVASIELVTSWLPFPPIVGGIIIVAGSYLTFRRTSGR